MFARQPLLESICLFSKTIYIINFEVYKASLFVWINFLHIAFKYIGILNMKLNGICYWIMPSFFFVKF